MLQQAVILPLEWARRGSETSSREADKGSVLVQAVLTDWRWDRVRPWPLPLTYNVIVPKARVLSSPRKAVLPALLCAHHLPHSDQYAEELAYLHPTFTSKRSVQARHMSERLPNRAMNYWLISQFETFTDLHSDNSWLQVTPAMMSPSCLVSPASNADYLETYNQARLYTTLEMENLLR